MFSDVCKQLARTKLSFSAALLVRGSSPFVGFLLLQSWRGATENHASFHFPRHMLFCLPPESQKPPPSWREWFSVEETAIEQVGSRICPHQYVFDVNSILCVRNSGTWKSVSYSFIDLDNAFCRMPFCFCRGGGMLQMVWPKQSSNLNSHTTRIYCEHNATGKSVKPNKSNI